MALEEDSQNSTALRTPMGLNKWKRLLISLASAPGAIQNLIELILKRLLYEISFKYLDNFIIFGKKNLKNFLTEWNLFCVK